MKPNIGAADRGIRIGLGLGIIGVGAYLGSWWGAVGVVPLLTAVVRFCPAYVPFGLSTCAREERKS
jgi:hypothetical protein